VKTTENPLLETPSALPEFDRIKPEHVLPAIESRMAQYHEQLAPVLTHPDQTDWDGFVAVEERLLTDLDESFSPASHLHAVMDSPEWREVYAEAVVLVTDFSTTLDQNPKRFAAYRHIHQSTQFTALNSAQQAVIIKALRDFRLSGIDLPDEDQRRYRDLVRDLTELSTSFQQNLQDATDGWFCQFDDDSALDGLPDRALQMARQYAKQRDLTGVVVNLEFPSYQAVITYANDRTLREQVYTAYCTRASDQGPQAGQWDNASLIEDILARRDELAKLLGFDRYIEYSLETKMARSHQEVDQFLVALADKARPRALDELQSLTDFAQQNGLPADQPLCAWDIPYFSERLRQQQYQVSDEEIRPYFPVEKCIDGLFEVVQSLFGISMQADALVAVWHPDVRFYRLMDHDGEPIAACYMDLFARKGKRGGAWMADCRSLRETATGKQLPVAYLNCNFAAPDDGNDSLLNHNELTTLFHEFGHCLHHMLTQIPYPAVGGIANVEWDAVELPSQFLENWCWQYPALVRFSAHHQSGEVLPEALFERMRAARHFQSGLFLLRQIEFGLLDFRLHARPGEAPESVVNEVRGEVAVVEYPDFNRFINGFGHLFAGGYAAGYYSYLWAEQLAADAFDRFVTEGIFNAQTGDSFRREVLARGGSRPAAESFEAFRGRQPVIEPLLDSYGL